MAQKNENPFEQPVEIDVQQDGRPTERASSDDLKAASPELPSNGGNGELEAALAEAEAELAKHRDALLRIQAESENLRKRLMRDQERSRKFALEGIMKDLLQVRDSLERGLEISGESATVDSLREGQELTLKMLGKVLQDHHLEIIDPAGEPFDPEWHEAMTVLPSAEHEDNTVLEVLQKGFRLHDRLIRPARVVVSRKP